MNVKFVKGEYSMKEFFRKQCANMISVARIIAAISLYFFTTVSYPFVIVYVFCGLTDLLDGKIARKLNTTSTLGALLDTIGDMLTYFGFAKILFMQHLVPLWAFLWFIAILTGNVIGGVIAKKRFGEFYLVHSFFGRVVGGLLFLLPLMLRITQDIAYNNCYCLGLLGVIGTLSAIEAIYIQLKSTEKHMEITSLKQMKNL